MKIISDEPLRVTTLGGSAVLFEPGVPRELSEEIGLIAIQMGAREITSDGDESAEVKAEAEITPPEQNDASEEPVPDPIADELRKALLGLMEDGNPQNFNADGVPKAAVVNKIMGKTIDGDTRKAAWESILNS